ncbi:MAG: hypothetical protein ACTHOH_11925 [Lysobacteraceae bacterium]
MALIRTLPLPLLALAATLSTTACAGSGPRATEAAAPAEAPATRSTTTGGTIAGRIAYDDGAAPALRICAIGSGDPATARHVCTTTAAGATEYRITGLPADDYGVFAWTRSGPSRVGGHVQQVQCIRAPCPPMPMDVTVGSGARVDGVDLNGFFDSRNDFPPMPND